MYSLSLFLLFIFAYCLSHAIRNPAICICENKDADQLCGNLANQLCSDSAAAPLLPKSTIFKPLAVFRCCTARFVSDHVRNPEDRLFRGMAHLSNVVGAFCSFLQYTR